MTGQYLDMGVKEVIQQFPIVGEILIRYGIGCVPCTIGSCKLAEVVRIHTLPPREETEMMALIRQAIGASEGAPALRLPSEKRPAVMPFRYSPPVRKLVEEHVLIKRLLVIVPEIIREMRQTGEINASLLEGALDFIRGYADRYHHLKEEDILFDYADRQAEIIQVILQDHTRARGFVREAAKALETGDLPALCENLAAYQELLTEHINKEDTILYPHIDRGLSTSQVGELFRRFQEAEAQSDSDLPQRYERFIQNLEGQYQDKEEAPCQTLIVAAPAPG